MSLPKPFFEDKDTTVYCAKCEDILPHLGRFDLLLTDPPYGIFKSVNASGMMFGRRTVYCSDNGTQWDERPSVDLLNACAAIADKRIVWGGNYFADILGAWKGSLVWDKMTGNNSYADGELAWSDVVGTMRIFRHQWCGAFKDSERGMKAMHPTQKPVELMSWCLSFVPAAKTCLDPFGGSLTTAVACKLRGVHCTIIEQSEKYCALGVERLRQGVLITA